MSERTDCFLTHILMNSKRSAHNRVDLYSLSELNYGSTNGISKYSATDFARFLPIALMLSLIH
jgi:hypothetical protein